MNTIIRAQLFEYSNNPNIRGNTVLVHMKSKKSEFEAIKAYISEKYVKFGQIGTFFHVLENVYFIGDN